MLRWAGFHVTALDWIDLSIPGWLIMTLGALVLLALVWYQWRFSARITSSLEYSDLKLLKRTASSRRSKFGFLPKLLRLLALAALFVGFARPQSGVEKREITTEGIDIILALDVSGSMKAEDFKPHNRLYVAKEKIKEFVGKRVSDRIGLVVFARTAFTQAPLTTDYTALLSFLDMVSFGMIDDGTAIGTALATSVNRLKDSQSESKVIIMLTDGVNNAGEIDPLTAANVARAFDIKVYTIAVGRPGNAMYPVDDPIFGQRYAYLPTEIDEETLKAIAERTDGVFYRARSEDELKGIYEEIDQLEKTEIQVNEFVNYSELFPFFMLLGFALLFSETLLGQTIFRKAP